MLGNNTSRGASDISMFARGDQKSIFGQLAHQINNHDDTVATIDDTNMLHINQTSAFINAGVPLLHYSYSNRGQEKEALVKYQLMYYSFPTEEELDVGDGFIEMAIRLEYLKYDFINEIETSGKALTIQKMKEKGLVLEDFLVQTPSFESNDAPSIVLKIPTALGRTVNAVEIAALIHQQLMVYQQYYMDDFGLDLPQEGHTMARLALIWFFSIFRKFSFDAGT